MIYKPKHLLSFHFDIVHGCQLRCVGCPNSTLLPKVERISVSDFGLCLSHVDVEKVHTFRLFNYGEPLLHRDLPGILQEIPRQQWRASVIEISTNAQWVDWEQFEEAVRLEIVTRLVVSCDGDGTPESYEALRPPATWSKLMEFLLRARQIRDRWAPAMQLLTRTVVRNAQDAARWESVLRPLGWLPEFRAWMALPEAAQDLTDRKRSVPAGPCVFFADASEYTQHPWFGEINLLYADADGTVVPCCMHPRAGVFGNLKHEYYSEILAGERRARMKSQMQSDRTKLSACGQCDVGPIGDEGPSFWSTFAYWSRRESMPG